jgi:hypothetical protein
MYAHNNEEINIKDVTIIEPVLSMKPVEDDDVEDEDDDDDDEFTYDDKLRMYDMNDF